MTGTMTGLFMILKDIVIELVCVLHPEIPIVNLLA